jgi:predicted ester cyclase
MSIEDTKAIGNRFIAIFNEQNPAIADEIFAPNFSARLPGAPALDREGWKAFLGIFRTGFPDLHLEAEEMVATKDRLIIRVILHGTHQGVFLGMAPTGKRVAFTGIAMFRIADGQAIEHWGEMDILGMMQQLGAIPSPE